MLCGQTSAGRSADLHCFEFRTFLKAAADLINDLPQGGSHGNFDQAGILNGTRQGEGLGSRASLCSDRTEPLMSL